LGAGTQIQQNGKTILSISLVAQNLTDIAYQNHLSRLKYTSVNEVTGRMGVFNMGRNVSLKINIPLVFD
jgi:iron complex outermembrane receptor protein